MSSKGMLALVAVVAVGAAAIAWFSLASERPTARIEPVPEQREIELAVEPPPPMADHADEAVVSELAADALDESSLAREPFTVLLRGNVTCDLGPLELTQISITTSRVYAPVLTAVVAADGAFEVDVTSLVVSNDESELLVDARHPNAMAEHLVVAPDAFRGLARGEKRVIPLEIMLVRAACMVDVRVNMESALGAPVTVSVYGVSGPVLGSRHEHEVGYRGSFQFQVPAGEYVLLAYVPALRPTTVRFGCAARGRAELEPITLGSGAKLSGWVAVHGELVRGADVAARLGGAPKSDSPQLHWTGASFEWSLREAVQHYSGRFEVSGLAPAEYELSVTGITGVPHRDLASRAVVAPASDILLEPKVCRLVLEVLVGGESKRIQFKTQQTILRDGARHTSYGSGLTTSGRATVWLGLGSSNEAVFDMSEILGVPGAPERTIELPRCTDGEDLTLRIDL